MTTEKETTPPSREDMIVWYKEQIEFLKVQHEYAKLRKEVQEFEADRLEAISKIAFYQGKLEQSAQPEGSEEEKSGDE